MNTKILTVHSEDRDIARWPNPNEFEINLPVNYTNIKEINLLNFTNTNNFFNISRSLLNNILIFRLNSDSQNRQILIPDGFYTPDQLALVLTRLFKLQNLDIYVLYHRIQFRFLFLCKHSFRLDFRELADNAIPCESPNHFTNPNRMILQYAHWGIGYNLGFKNKERYDSSLNSIIDQTIKNTKEVNKFDICLNDMHNIIPNDIDINNIHLLYSDGIIDLNIDNIIYMEIDRFNFADQIVPYQHRSNWLYCNDYSAAVDSFFAKITLNSDNNNNIINTTTSDGKISFGNFKCKNVVDRIMRLRFKFRYHNGLLVDFNNRNFNFTLEFVQECPELLNKKNI